MSRFLVFVIVVHQFYICLLIRIQESHVTCDQVTLTWLQRYFNAIETSIVFF